MPRPKVRDQRLRQQILVQARGLLAAGGPTAVTARGVASAASTSPPAVYELFGDKQGLIRALFFEGFRELGAALEALPTTDSPAADLRATMVAFRWFSLENPHMVHLMFARSFAEFEPGPDEQRAGAAVRAHLVGRVERCHPGEDPVDRAHVALGVAQGLALQESAGWLGSSVESRDRRWELALRAILA